MNDLKKCVDNSEPIFNMILKSYNIIDKYYSKKHKKLITTFHKLILEGNASNEKIKYETENIKVIPEDFHNLLKYTIEDMEEEKVYIYVNIYKYIRDNQDINNEYKKKIIKIASYLPLSAIKLIKDLSSVLNEDYLNHKSEFSKITNNPKNRYEVNLIIQYNIFMNDENQITNVIRIKPSELYPFIINSFFYKGNKDKTK